MHFKNIIRFLAISIFIFSFQKSLSQVSDLQNGLIVNYEFNGDVNDSSGNNHHATSNATLTEDRFGNSNAAYSFNGVDEFIDLPNTTDLKPNLPVTISFWAYFEDLTVDKTYVFTNDFTEDLNMGINFNLSSAGNFAVSLNNGGAPSASSRKTKISDSTIQANTWYYFLVTISSFNNIDLYINEFNAGSLCTPEPGTFSGTATTLAYSTNQGSIGRNDVHTTNSPYYFQGKIDELKMWNRVLNSTEITDLCNLQNNASPTQPTLTATGNEPYCPLSQIPIVTSFNITNPDTVEIEKVFVQISQGYQTGEDTLILTGSHPNITAQPFNVTEGKIELEWTGSGAPNDTELINAVESIVFESNSATASGNRSFSITIGEANYLPSTDHYYEYIPDIGITWSAAKIAAESRTFYGLTGYLATITTPEEAQLTGEQAAGAGWIGGSDEALEGTWRWVTGPEGLENGGIGRQFWQGNGSGSNTAPDFYSFWNSSNNEPNNLGDEDYAHVTAPGVGLAGSWNDLSNVGGSSGNYQPKGYIVEYGGMPGESNPDISASSEIFIPEITSSTPSAICGAGNITINATASSGDVLWFDVATGGTPVFTGNSFTTTLSTTTTFYALASENGCYEGIRVPVLAEVKTIPTITSTTDDLICGVGDAILSAIPSAGIVNWYDAPSGGNLVGTGNNITLTSISATTTLYAEAEENGCISTTRTPVIATVQYTSEPTAVSPQTFCDIDNASIGDIAITGTSVLWYSTPTGGTPLASSEVLTSTTYYASQTILGCESLTRLPVAITVFTTVVPLASADIPSINVCDNNLDGDDTNGFSEFDLTLNESVLLNGESAADFSFSYFTNNSYAPASEILNPTNYVNSVVNTETIYVRISNNLDNSCFTDSSFEINVNPLPVIQNSVTLKNCDEDGVSDGFTDFNLTEADFFITNGDASLSVSYYLSIADASNQTNPVNPSPFNNNIANTVYARVENSFGCYRVATVSLEVSVTILPPGFNYEIVNCDTDATIDGLTAFDLTEASTYFLTLLPPQNLSIHYYQSLVDAQLEENEILPQDAYVNTTPFFEQLYVRVESVDNGDCFGIGQHLNLRVNPRPEFNIPENDILCLNLGVKTIIASSSTPGLTYEWFNESGNLIGTQASIDITAAGLYTAIATSTSGCESFPQTIEILESDIATITLNDISVTDDSSNNTITVNTANLGVGDYEFALDDLYGPYQEEPFFENVAPGIHTLYIQDKNNCGISQIDVSVIGYPKFFTPNNDGENDTWHIKGVNPSFYPTSEIYIFDRFGKLLTKLNPTENGWDGFYNGKQSPATDYWFTAQLIDENGNIREKKGHFSLIR